MQKSCEERRRLFLALTAISTLGIIAGLWTVTYLMS